MAARPERREEDSPSLALRDVHQGHKAHGWTNSSLPIVAVRGEPSSTAGHPEIRHLRRGRIVLTAAEELELAAVIGWQMVMVHRL
eukprot:SAG11_NODE_31385_length_292_cov_0.803109_1_plen_84_part_01